MKLGVDPPPPKKLNIIRRKFFEKGGSRSGLVVMGGDSSSEGRGFASHLNILDVHFVTYICCKNCCTYCLFEKMKINEEINEKSLPFECCNKSEERHTSISCQFARARSSLSK